MSTLFGRLVAVVTSPAALNVVGLLLGAGGSAAVLIAAWSVSAAAGVMATGALCVLASAAFLLVDDGEV